MEYTSDKFESEISKIAEKSLGVISDLYDICASESDFKKAIKYRGCDIYVELHQEIININLVDNISINLEITIMNQLNDEVHTEFSVVYPNTNGVPKDEFTEWFVNKMRAVKVTADLMTTEA